MGSTHTIELDDNLTKICYIEDEEGQRERQRDRERQRIGK